MSRSLEHRIDDRRDGPASSGFTCARRPAEEELMLRRTLMAALAFLFWSLRRRASADSLVLQFEVAGGCTIGRLTSRRRRALPPGRARCDDPARRAGHHPVGGARRRQGSECRGRLDALPALAARDGRARSSISRRSFSIPGCSWRAGATEAPAAGGFSKARRSASGSPATNIRSSPGWRSSVSIPTDPTPTSPCCGKAAGSNC